MTLATQCPHCNTTFRVAESQLIAHGGLVRCGVCTRVFNGNDFLKQDDDTLSSDALFDATVATTPPVTPRNAPLNIISAPLPDAARASTSAHPSWETAVDNPTPTAPHTAPYTSAARPFRSTAEPFIGEDEMDALAIEEGLPDDDLSGFTAPASQAGLHSEPNFVKANRRKQRVRKILRIIMAIAAVPLLLGALGQGIYFYRHQLAISFPQVKPLLIAACATLHCRVGLSTDIEQLSLESNELETLPGTPDTFALSILLRNNGELPQAWPHIELTLNDTGEIPQVKRVFTPQEYLPANHPVADGFTQHSEQMVVVRFSLTDALASGYRVYLFYP